MKGRKGKFIEWWTMHVSIPLGALMLSYRTLKEEVKGTIMQSEWEFTASGNRCAWCAGSGYEPFDSHDAEQKLCRGHVAEFEGTSLAGLDRWDDAISADMAELGYFD